MRVIWRIFKTGLLALILLLLVVAGAGLAVLQWPSLLVNPRTLRMGAQFADRFGIHARWSKAEVEARSETFYRKSLKIDLQNVCVRDAGDGVKKSDYAGCFDEVKVATRLDFTGFKFKVLEIGPIAFLGGDVDAMLATNPDPAPEKKEDPKKAASAKDQGGMPEMLRDAKLQKITLALDRWRVRTGEKLALGRLHFANNLEKPGAWWDLSLAERLTGAGTASNRGEVNLAIRSPEAIWKGPWTVDGEAKTVFDDGKDIRAKVYVRQTGELDFDYKLEASLIEGARLAVAGVEGKFKPTAVEGKIHGTARNFQEMVPYASLGTCTYALTRKGVETSSGNFKFDCPLAFRLKVPPVKQLPDFKMPTETGMKLSLDLNTSYPPAMDQHLDGTVKLDVDPVLTPLLEGEARAQSAIAGTPSEFPKAWKLDTQLGVKLRIPKFEEVVAMLRKGAWAVPAPINDLKGDIEVGSTGHVDLNGGALPLYLRTRLGSESQSVKIAGHGEMRFELPSEGKALKTDLDMDVVLNDIQLALPRLDLEKPPRFFPDSRIQEKPVGQQMAGQAAPPASNSHYRVSVRTPEGHPIRIVTNLVKEPVPITMDIVNESGEPMDGQVRISNFDVELFRRKANIEKLDLVFDPEEDGINLDGSVKLAYTDYTIQILLYGTAKEPQVKLLSDPPVDEKQLMAVLLFGRPLGELDEDQADSVGHTQSALADGAVGLASLYALASTPIESVGYDPTTKSFSAKVHLAEGTSLNMGTGQSTTLGSQNADQTYIGIRKRLSSHWTITTDVARTSSSNSDSSGSALGAFLEWSNRY